MPYPPDETRPVPTFNLSTSGVLQYEQTRRDPLVHRFAFFALLFGPVVGVGMPIGEWDANRLFREGAAFATNSIGTFHCLWPTTFSALTCVVLLVLGYGGYRYRVSGRSGVLLMSAAGWLVLSTLNQLIHSAASIFRQLDLFDLAYARYENGGLVWIGLYGLSPLCAVAFFPFSVVWVIRRRDDRRIETLVPVWLAVFGLSQGARLYWSREGAFDLSFISELPGYLWWYYSVLGQLANLFAYFVALFLFVVGVLFVLWPAVGRRCIIAGCLALCLIVLAYSVLMIVTYGCHFLGVIPTGGAAGYGILSLLTDLSHTTYRAFWSAAMPVSALIVLRSAWPGWRRSADKTVEATPGQLPFDGAV